MARKKKKSNSVSRKIPRRESSTRVYTKKCACATGHCKKSSCGKGKLQGVPVHFRCPPGHQTTKTYSEGNKPACKGGKRPIQVKSYDRCKPIPHSPKKGCGGPR